MAFRMSTLRGPSLRCVGDGSLRVHFRMVPRSQILRVNPPQHAMRAASGLGFQRMPLHRVAHGSSRTLEIRSERQSNADVRCTACLKNAPHAIGRGCKVDSSRFGPPAD